MKYLQCRYQQEDVPYFIPLYSHQTDTAEELEEEFEYWLFMFKQTNVTEIIKHERSNTINDMVLQYLSRPFLLKDIMEVIERYRDNKT